MECDICTEKINKTTRRLCTCMYCDGKACLMCVKTNIKDSSVVFCMFCKKEWQDLDFLKTTFGPTYMNTEYREIREKFLLDREVALLPETQLVIEVMKRNEQYEEKIYDLERGISDIRRIIQRYRRAIANNQPFDENISDEEIRQERKQFIRKCPKDDCRGFLSTQWKCGICESNVCKDCLVIKSNDENAPPHACNPDDVKTAELIAKETKPCPKCGTYIYKIDGCDQMWCTSCHAAFSWKSGQIVTDRVHNPHFYEWQRQTNGGEAPRVEGDNPGCHNGDDFVEIQIFRRSICEKLFPTEEPRYFHRLPLPKEYIFLHGMHRIATHISGVEIKRIFPPDNQDLRINYLQNLINQVYFKYYLRLRQQKYDRIVAFNEVFEMFVGATNTILVNIMNDKQTLVEGAEQAKNLVLFFNQQFDIVKKRYNSKRNFALHITNDGDIRV